MATRKRIANKVPSYKLPKKQGEQEEQDLKKVRAAMLKELEDNKQKIREWYDSELEKQMKKV